MMLHLIYLLSHPCITKDILKFQNMHVLVQFRCLVNKESNVKSRMKDIITL